MPSASPSPRVTVWVQRFPDRKNLVLQWLDPDTHRRKSKTASSADRALAEQLAKDLAYELTHGKYVEASRMTWERFRELFEAEYVAGLRPNTRANYAEMLDLFEELCNPLRLRSVNERTISAFVAAMRKRPCRGREGRQPSTIKVRLQFLHTALAWAADQNLIPACPRFPSVKVPRKRPQPVVLEAFEKLLAKAPDEEMRSFLLCGWLAGLRLSEAVLLEREPTQTAPYLDLARNRIVLPAAFVKADEDQWVPLDQELREALLSFPRHGRRVFRFESRSGQPISASAVSDRVSRLAKLAGVKLTMHSLRKGFDCRYAGEVPAQVLQRLMRHASIKTTMDYYANVDEAVEAAVRGRKRNALRNSPVDGFSAAEK